MLAILIKNNAWSYASGETVQPKVTEGDKVAKESPKKWQK